MNVVQKITPCLWFDNQAEQAAEFYTSIFNNPKIVAVTRMAMLVMRFFNNDPGRL